MTGGGEISKAVSMSKSHFALHAPSDIHVGTSRHSSEAAIGLKNTDKGIEGHAWISYKEQIIFDKKEDIEVYQFKHRIE